MQPHVGWHGLYNRHHVLVTETGAHMHVVPRQLGTQYVVNWNDKNVSKGVYIMICSCGSLKVTTI